MVDFKNFNFSEFDRGSKIGGQLDGTEVEGDKKLTGAEARAARAAGWTVWDGFSEQNGTPENVNQEALVNKDVGGNSGVNKDSSKVGIKLPKWALEMIKRKPSDKQVENISNIDKVNKKIKNLTKEDLNKIVNKIIKDKNSVKVNDRPIDDVISDLTDKNVDKLTAEQKEARTELNQKQSSIGMTYADAKAKVTEILLKYPDCYDEIEVSNDPMPDENGNTILIHREPTIKKVFNPDRLPEPARTEYKEAMASMAEIENNNSELAQKGGINKTPLSNPEINTIEQRLRDVDNHFGLDGLEIKDGQIITKEKEPTQTQKSARAKLNEKVSTTGMSYKDAKITIESITNQYKNNPDYQSEFEQEQNKTLYTYRPPIKAFDPYKLKGADREVFFNALSAIHEIEKANYALLTQAGLSLTKDPEMPQSKEKYFT